MTRVLRVKKTFYLRRIDCRNLWRVDCQNLWRADCQNLWRADCQNMWRVDCQMLWRVPNRTSDFIIPYQGTVFCTQRSL